MTDDAEAKLAITEVLYRYCRALDRMDRDLADTIWHPGGTADYGPTFQGPAAGLLDAIPVPNPELRRSKPARVAVRGELPSPVHPPSGCRFRTRCPRAQDRCAEVVPPLRRFGEHHHAACHYPLQPPLPDAQAPPGPDAAADPEKAPERETTP